MHVRPVTRHWCETCGEDHDGRLQETTPVFMIGCCFDIVWQGTRDQAADLYDYLVNRGYLEPRKQAACGDWDDDNIQYDETFWRCGACGVTYGPGMKEVAVACCKSRVAVAA